MNTIEDIILDHDKRGISELRNLVPQDFCKRSSDLILENPGKVFITTGFYILTAGAAETDGPPGAIAIGNALEKLGYEIVYITAETFTKSAEANVLDELGLTKICCRRHMLTHVDIE